MRKRAVLVAASLVALSCAQRPVHYRDPVIMVPLAEAAAPLRGPCVDAGADAETRRPQTETVSLGAPRDLTLDEHGTRAVVFGFGAAFDEGTLVYVVTHDCARFAGDLSGGQVSALETKTMGLADLQILNYGPYCEGDPCGCDPSVDTYTFGGVVYEADPTRHFAGAPHECPDDAPGAAPPIAPPPAPNTPAPTTPDPNHDGSD